MFIREKTSVVLVRLALGVIAGTSLLTQGHLEKPRQFWHDVDELTPIGFQ